MAPCCDQKEHALGVEAVSAELWERAGAVLRKYLWRMRRSWSAVVSHARSPIRLGSAISSGALAAVRVRLLGIGGPGAVPRGDRGGRRVHKRDAVVQRGVRRVCGELEFAHTAVQPHDSPAERELRPDVPPAAAHSPEMASIPNNQKLSYVMFNVRILYIVH